MSRRTGTRRPLSPVKQYVLGETVSGGEIVSETEFRFAWTQRTGEWIGRAEGFKAA